VSSANKDAVPGTGAKLEVVQKSDESLSEAVLGCVDAQAIGEADADAHEGHETPGIEECQVNKVPHEIEEHSVDEHIEDHHGDEFSLHSEAVVESNDENPPDGVHHSVQYDKTVGLIGSTDALTDDVHVSQHDDASIKSVEESQHDNISIPPSSPVSHPALEDNLTPVGHHHNVEDKKHSAGTELEDIVNLLESVPKVERPSLEPLSVSDAEEIPDEY